MALRVFSIIEINKLIDDTKRMKSNEAARKESVRELIEWMKDNSLFDLLWNSSEVDRYQLTSTSASIET